VVTINVRENAAEFRVEIAGRFAHGAVADVHYIWQSVLDEGERRLTVDISQMSSYDYAGCALLRDMCRYGVQIAASTAESLVFLSEISSPRPPRPELIPKRSATITPFPRQRAAASGE